MSREELDAIRRMLAGRPSIDADLAARRTGFEAAMARFPLPPDLVFEPTIWAGRPAAWVSTPGARADRAVLWFHGGAFMLGSPRAYAEFAGRLSRAARARVLLPDYPLAPEHPFPAAADHALDAYRALIEAHPPGAVAVGGDSSGANLALVSLLAARDAGLPMPAAGGFASAYLDMTHRRPSIAERGPRDPFVEVSKIDHPLSLYAPGADPADPRLSPIFARLDGLPPLLLQVGEDEALHDDSVDFAAAARAAGVEAEAEVWPGMIHVWHLFGPVLSEGREATDRLGAFFRGRMAP